MDLIYHEIKPSNDIQGVNGFTEYNTIDFNVIAPGRKMLGKTVKIAAQLIVNTNGVSAPTGTRKAPGDNIYLDHKIGAHAVFSSIQCEISGGPKAQVLENLQEYPRYCSLLHTASRKELDACSVISSAELKGSFEANGSINIEQQKTNVANASVAADEDPSFCITPKICFNQSMGDSYSFSKNGNIKISCNLARTVNAFYGQDMSSQVTYSLQNVRLLFTSIPDDGKEGKMMMSSYVMVKSTMVSSQVNVQARVPSRAVKSVSIVFLRQKQESSLVQNTNELQSLPQLDEVSYSFQDTLTNYVTYNITDLNDALIRGVESVPGNRPLHNSSQPELRAANRSYILGTDFDNQILDLSAQKFGFLCKSKFSGISNDQRLVYLFFHTELML